jgi:hypothetical protein
MKDQVKTARLMENQNSAPEIQFRPEDLWDRYQIKKDAYYARIKFLGIKPKRDSNKRVYLTEEQVKDLDALHSHIEKTGKMEGFDSNNDSAEESALVRAETREIAAGASSMIDRPTAPVEAGQPHPDQFAALVRSAAEYAAGMELAKYTIASKFQENPDLLPDDLKQQVEEAKRQTAPKSQNPKAIAQQFLNQYGITA